MTGIIVDKYKHEIFVFADGRVIEDEHYVLTDNDLKIRRSDARNVFTNCGDANIMDDCMLLIDEDRLNFEGIKDMNGDGQFIWVTKDTLTIVEFNPPGAEWDPNSEKKQLNTICSFKNDSLPMFFGSGKIALSGAYYAMECQKAKSRQEYLDLITKCYKGACKRDISMGPLNQTEAIKIGNGKNEKAKHKETKVKSEPRERDTVQEISKEEPSVSQDPLS